MTSQFLMWLSLISLLIRAEALAAGIPEPGLLMFGAVRELPGNARITTGNVTWTLTSPSGSDIIVETILTNINDQFSYALRIPFETVLAGFTLSPSTLSLSNNPVTYGRTATVNLQPATIVPPAAASFTFGPADRGRMERVDLNVSLAFVDSDGNGLDDNWEMANFGHLGVDPNADPDHDGMSNFAEYKAGTDPNDPQSRFAFLDVRPDPLGGMAVRWSSVSLHKYTLMRSASLLLPFANLQTNIDATPGTNYFRDASGTNGSFFYRLRVE